MEFVKLFSPITINGMTVANRIVMPAMGLHFADSYDFTERYKDFYRERARGGVGLMLIGPIAIDLVGSVPGLPGIFEDGQIAPLREFIAELHGETPVKLGTQLFQMGRSAFGWGGLQPIAPSPIYSRISRQVPREMTLADIAAVQDAFAAATRRCRRAGFDYIEAVGCTGYLISEFLSPVTNRRTDAYGGSLEKRMRFGIEVMERMREAAGPDIAVGMRVAGNDFVEGGHTNDEQAVFCRELEKAGADVINVTGGWHETNIPQLTANVPPGAYVYLARGIKEQVGITVFASNRLGDPVVAEKALRSGAADMVCWARPLLADPALPRKIKEGRDDEIVSCISCNQGCFDSIFGFLSVTCILNPRCGREAEWRSAPAKAKKKILVAGGGPAGMEFAAAAARRGHDVTLYEREERLGGQARLAAAVPGKEEFRKIAAGMEKRLRLAGAAVRCGTTLTADEVKWTQPDCLVVATGAQPIAPAVPGIDKPHVVQAWEVLTGNVPDVGRRVVIVGGSAVGCETAEYLAVQGAPDAETVAFLMFHSAEDPAWLREKMLHSGRRITVIEMLERFADNVSRTQRWSLLKSLRLRGVELRGGTKLVEVTDDGVVVETPSGREAIPADTVVMAVGAKSVDGLAREASSLGIEVITLGDAKQPRRLNEAIAEGLRAALDV